MTSPRVSVRNLTKIYKTKRGSHVALDNVSLDIDAGEFVVLLGPSGCGKTTLLRCIAGLEEPDAGEIIIDGKLVFSSEKGVYVPPERRDLSMVFQSYALWPHLSVLDNVVYPLRNTGKSSADAAVLAKEALAKVGLADYSARFPGQLSGGQQQRVALARAIVSGDGLILFDEPLSNLDAKVRERLRLELLSLQSQINFSAVYVTHDQIEALALADRIAVMDVGRIAQVGSPEQIYDYPNSRYVADFIGSANEFAGTVKNVGDVLTVETAIGELEVGNFHSDLVAGQPVWLVVRPEHCTFDGIGEGHNRFTGTLVRTLYLGASRQHFVETAAGELVVTTQTPIAVGEKERVTIGCAPQRIHAFPREV